MESFSSGKIGGDINAIVNSRPRVGGRGRMLVLCLRAYAIPSILMPDAFDSDTNHCYELNFQPYN